jgi:branched-chain amino acid transport system permease protein
MLITLFDRLLLAQMTHLIRWVGAQTGIAVLTTVDLTLWRWFFFGLGLALVMLFKPEGLVGRRVKPAAVDVDETEEAGLLVAAPAPPRAESIRPGCDPDRPATPAAIRCSRPGA